MDMGLFGKKNIYGTLLKITLFRQITKENQKDNH